MSKHSSKRSRDSTTITTDDYNPYTQYENLPDDWFSATASPDLREFEDRRRYHPDKSLLRQSQSLFREARMLVPSERRYYNKLAYAEPGYVITCVRRAIRRQVLLAMGARGAGKRHKRKPRYNERSKVKC